MRAGCLQRDTTFPFQTPAQADSSPEASPNVGPSSDGIALSSVVALPPLGHLKQLHACR